MSLVHLIEWKTSLSDKNYEIGYKYDQHVIKFFPFSAALTTMNMKLF